MASTLRSIFLVKMVHLALRRPKALRKKKCKLKKKKRKKKCKLAPKIFIFDYDREFYPD